MTKNKVSPLNCMEIEEVLGKLALEGSFVRDIIQPDYKTLMLEFYQPGRGQIRLMLDLHAQKSSLYPLEKTDKVQGRNLRFAQMLRAHIRGARLISVYQYDYQRIIVFHVKLSGEEKYLYVRLWAARSNIFLCDAQGNILDVFFRRPDSGEISEKVFTLPVPQGPPKSYDLRVLEGTKGFASAVRQYFYENNPEGGTQEDFLAWHQAQVHRIESKIKKVRSQRENNAKLMQQYQQRGDELMGSLHLSADSSVRKDAQAYYEKKKSLKQKNEYLAMQLNILENQRIGLQKQYDLRDDEDFLGSRAWQKDANNEKRAHSVLSFVRQGITFLVGRSARENDFLLRHVVKSHEWWLHVRDYAGCYVFVRTKKNQPLPDSVRLDACALAVHYSKAKDASYVDIHCTQVKYLRRIKNEVGKVSVTREKPISYRVDQKKLLEILNQPH